MLPPLLLLLPLRYALLSVDEISVIVACHDADHACYAI